MSQNPFGCSAQSCAFRLPDRSSGPTTDDPCQCVPRMSQREHARLCEAIRWMVVEVSQLDSDLKYLRAEHRRLTAITGVP